MNESVNLKARQKVESLLVKVDPDKGWNPDDMGKPIHHAPKKQRFQLLKRSEFNQLPSTKWLIKRVMPANGVSMIFGGSGSGKSFIAIDMAAAIAQGKDWFGFKTKQAHVTYCPLEGQSGFLKRIKAWEMVNGMDLPEGFQIQPDHFNLTDDDDVEALAAQIPSGSVIFIDTQAQASEGVDENTSEGMGRVIGGAQRLQHLTQGTVILIHHTGKDTSKGSRGHSSMRASLEAQIEIFHEKGKEFRKWSIEKMKDDDDNLSMGFRLNPVEIGRDEDGDAITSCTIEIAVARYGDEDVTGRDVERLWCELGTKDDEYLVKNARAIPTSDGWIGKKLKDMLKIDSDERIKEIIKMWEKSKVLIRVEIKDSSRKPKPCFRVSDSVKPEPFL